MGKTKNYCLRLGPQSWRIKWRTTSTLGFAEECKVPTGSHTQQLDTWVLGNTGRNAGLGSCTTAKHLGP